MKKTKLETDLFYYGNYLELIGKFSLSKQLTLKDLGNTDEDKAVIQKCYRDIKKDKFEGTVIDYLCSISAEYILDMWVKKSEDEKYHASAKEYLLDFKSFSKKKDFAGLMPIYMVIFLLICHENKSHAKNITRLFNKNPQIIIENRLGRTFHLITMDITRITLNFFNLFMILNSYEFLKEKLVDLQMEDKLWEYLLPISIETLVIKTHGWGNVNLTGIEPNKFIKFKLLDKS